MKIGVVGLRHLGEVVSTCLAELGHTVTAYDPNPAIVGKFEHGEPVLAEPGITELMAKNKKSGRLSYNIFSPEVARLHEVFFITFDTPVTQDDNPDTRLIEKTMLDIAHETKPGLLIVIMSQMPAGLTRELQRKIDALKKNIRLAYVPENLQLGTAIESFMRPARTIIGTDSKDAAVVTKIFEKLPGEKIVMSPTSAEMAKHALNSFLATSLSFIYNISDLCEVVGADVAAVSRALKSDPRIGAAAYLDTSLGFSGGTLMRDLRVLESRAKKAKLKIPVISGALTTNATRLARVLALLESAFGAPLKNKNVTVLGLTYKPGTPTLRASRAIELIRLLKRNGLAVSGSDPLAPVGEVTKETGVFATKNPYQAAKNSQAIIMMTACPEYANLNLKKLKKVMRAPFIFIDARNFLASRAKEFTHLGFGYHGVGRGSIDI